MVMVPHFKTFMVMEHQPYVCGTSVYILLHC